MKFGYMRVSSKSQDNKNGEARQKAILLENGVPEENLYYDVISGADFNNRKALEELEKVLREGDTLVISELSRLGRNTSETLKLIEQLSNKGISLYSVSEGFTIDNSPMGKCFLTICLAFAQMERELINERCNLGRKEAKEKGIVFGRKTIKDKNPEALEHALLLFQEGKKSVKDIAAITGISRATIYREAEKQGVKRM